jgi:hypothetical protein
MEKIAKMVFRDLLIILFGFGILSKKTTKVDLSKWYSDYIHNHQILKLYGSTHLNKKAHTDLADPYGLLTEIGIFIYFSPLYI